MERSFCPSLSECRILLDYIFLSVLRGLLVNDFKTRVFELLHELFVTQLQIDFALKNFLQLPDNFVWNFLLLLLITSQHRRALITVSWSSKYDWWISVRNCIFLASVPKFGWRSWCVFLYWRFPVQERPSSITDKNCSVPAMKGSGWRKRYQFKVGDFTGYISDPT